MYIGLYKCEGGDDRAMSKQGKKPPVGIRKKPKVGKVKKGKK